MKRLVDRARLAGGSGPGRLLRLVGRLCIAGALVGGVAHGPAYGQPPDPHQVYEQRCSRCHEPHAGDFALRHLERSGDALIGRESRRAVRGFLLAGHGGAPRAEAEALLAQLDAIVSAGGLFRDKCRICHDRAVVLARRELILRDGRLMGRYSDRDIADFLTHHGRLTAEEVPVVVDMLKRQLGSAGPQ